MNRMAMPITAVGNDFVVIAPKAKMKVQASIPAMTISPEEVLPKEHLGIADGTPDTRSRPLINLLHQHTIIIFAIALLIIGAAAIKLGANYWTARHISLSSTTTTIKTSTKPVSGFNMTVPATDFQTRLKSITSQPVTLTVGSYSEQVDGGIVKSWLQITANKNKSEYYIHVNQAAIGDSLIKEAGTYAKTPINQVTVSEDGTSRVVVGGKQGRALSDPNGLKTQAKEAAKNVLGAKGMQFNTPLTTTSFQAVGPEAFNKVLVADINTKKMWAFQNGQQVNSWLISAGKPSTPTPVGQFKVYAKFTVQDMKGTNPDGSPYFQPHVRWVSYFSAGSAVHGVYWHPRSWFGVNNSSHGCIGLPEDEAQWVYNWAPIGTTVIVHT